MLELLKLFIFYIFILYLTIFFSNKLGFYDKPDKTRKIHRFDTLNTSGIALYIFLIFVLIKYEFSYQIETIISAGALALICGFLDDRIKLEPSVKLIILVIPTVYLIFNGFFLSNLGEYQYFGLIKLNKFSFIFTLLACGLLINSYNYLDGMDGLLVSQILIGLIYIIFISKDVNDVKLLKIICIPLIINLIFNFLPTKSNYKIFLGNSGSLFLGFFMSFLMIYLHTFKKIHPAYLIWVVWLPVYDFLFVTFKRILENKIFYLPDNNHLHHILLKKMKNSHLKVTCILSSINILIIFLGYTIGRNLGEIYSLFLFILLYFIYMYVRQIILKSRGGAVR